MLDSFHILLCAVTLDSHVMADNRQLRKSERERKPSVRYVSSYGLRMVEASRSKVIQQQQTANFKNLTTPDDQNTSVKSKKRCSEAVFDKKVDLVPANDDAVSNPVNSHLHVDVVGDSGSLPEQEGTGEDFVVTSVSSPIPRPSGNGSSCDELKNSESPFDHGVDVAICQELDLVPANDDAASSPAKSHLHVHGGRANACKKNRHERYDRKVSSLSRCRKDLRKRMLSFEEPDKLPVYSRLILPEDWDDSDASADGPTDVSQKNQESIQLMKKSRKRQINMEDWKRNRIKRARAAGESYLGHNGNVVEKKVPPLEKSLCTAGCRFKCSQTVNDEAREGIFNAYYSLSNEAKDVYLFSCLKASPPKVTANCSARHREITVMYMINVEQQSRRICKKAFMSLHCISQSKVDHIINQVKDGLVTARQSLRGKHSTRPNKLSESRRKLVHEHINMFPAQPSHYSRHHNPNRLYLDATLSINSMYIDYVSWSQAKDHIPVSSFMYRQIFCEDFNLGFGSPRSDVCSRCETMQDELLTRHKENASIAFDVQRLDRIAARNGESIYITFDLQKTLPLPKLAVGEAFYLRRLWLYNVGVHLVSGGLEGAFFQLWTECDGKRGVREIASSLYTFFNVSGISDSDQSLVAWSDSCAGQNKNFKMLCFWQYLILKKYFKTIEHKFPIPGHSFLDSDRDFAKVEVAARRHENIYSVDQYQAIISGSTKKPKPTVTRVADKMFDIDKIIKDLRLVKRTVDVGGRKIEMRDKVRWIRMCEFGVFEYKHSFNSDEEWKQVVISCNNDVLPCPLIQLLPAANVPIAAPKLNDIKAQLKYVPPIYHGMYNSLTAANGQVHASDSEPEEIDDTLVNDIAVSSLFLNT
jgi:hypothetical protein